MAAGVTTMDCSAAEVTVRVVVPEIAPDVAVIIEVPPARPLDNPDADTAATDAVAEFQVTVAVMSCDVPSE